MKPGKGRKPYKRATVYNGDKEWFVSFHYWCTDTEKYVREKARISERGLTKEERQPILEDLRNELNKLIDIRNRDGLFHEKFVVKKKTKRLSVEEYLELYKNDKTIAESSRRTIGNSLHQVKKYHEQNPAFENILFEDISEAYLELFVEYLASQGLVGKTINMYLWAIQFVSEKLVKAKQLKMKADTEPFRVLQRKNETMMYRPLTIEEKETIFKYFKDTRPHFYLYILNIYYTSIRPSELKRLFIKNYDLRGHKILVPWYDSKNGLTNYVQILEPLQNALTDFGIKKSPPDHYLFSNRYEIGKEHYKGKWASDIWREACRKLGIPDDVNMYGLKHTFNVDYVEQNKGNVDWDWLRCHNRHATEQQTRDYLRGLTAYFLDETKAVILNYYNPTPAGGK